MPDLIATTLKELGRGKITDLTSNLQHHPAAKRLITKNKMTFGDGGYEAQFDVLVGNNGSARGVPLGWTAIPNIVDGVIQGTVPYRHTEFNWSVIRQEMSMNRGSARIVDLIKTRRIHAMVSWIEFLEDRFWKVPSASDDVNFYGVPYWIVKSATAATSANNDGFNGTVPSGYSNVAGISSTTYPMWRNYSDAYTTVSFDDLITKLRRALWYTNFTPPVDMPTFNKGDEYGLYTNYDTRARMINLVQSQNEDIGDDLASYEGNVLINRRPIEAVAKLNADTTGVIYGINWGEFGLMALGDEWMVETKIEKNPHQPSVYTTFTECSFNTICRNRRRNFVLSTGTTMP